MAHKDSRRYVKHWPNVLKDPSHAALFRADCQGKQQHTAKQKKLQSGNFFVQKYLSTEGQLYRYAQKFGIRASFYVSSIGPNYFCFTGPGRREMQYTPETKECAIQQKYKRGHRWDTYRVKSVYEAVCLFVRLDPVGQ